MANDRQSRNDRTDATPEEKAARHGSGQSQEPKQAQENSSSLWDTDQHSDAPGPFGTGSE